MSITGIVWASVFAIIKTAFPRERALLDFDPEGSCGRTQSGQERTWLSAFVRHPHAPALKETHDVAP
jgi:hypothetical protein